MRPIRQTEVVILIPQLADFVEYASRTNPRLEGRSLLKHRFRIDTSLTTPLPKGRGFLLH